MKIKDKERIWEGKNDQNLDRIIEMSMWLVFQSLGACQWNNDKASHGGWFCFDTTLKLQDFKLGSRKKNE